MALGRGWKEAGSSVARMDFIKDSSNCSGASMPGRHNRSEAGSQLCRLPLSFPEVTGAAMFTLRLTSVLEPIG